MARLSPWSFCRHHDQKTFRRHYFRLTCRQAVNISDKVKEKETSVPTKQHKTGHSVGFFGAEKEKECPNIGSSHCSNQCRVRNFRHRGKVIRCLKIKKKHFSAGQRTCTRRNTLPAMMMTGLAHIPRHQCSTLCSRVRVLGIGVHCMHFNFFLASSTLWLV